MYPYHSLYAPLGVIVGLLSSLRGAYGLAPLPLCKVIGVLRAEHVRWWRQVDAGIGHILKEYINGIFLGLGKCYAGK